MDVPDRFATTRWSMVIDAAGNGDSARDALTALCEIYRPPVLAYVRAHLHRGEDAEDLVQDFFAQLLERDLAARADPERGRFRAFLLTSLKNFLVNEHERVNALRRGGGLQMLPATAFESVPDSHAGPDEAFDLEWARTVLREGLRRLQQEAQQAGRADLFASLRPFLVDTPGEAEYETVAKAHGLRRNTVAVAVHRMRARLQELVHEVLADTARGKHDIEEEARHLRDAFSPPPTRKS
jgi:RNA polymerase sigma-70 factor (ECF subfamily)